MRTTGPITLLNTTGTYDSTLTVSAPNQLGILVLPNVLLTPQRSNPGCNKCLYIAQHLKRLINLWKNLWNVLPPSCFPESYNLPSFRSKINKIHMSMQISLQIFLNLSYHNVTVPNRGKYDLIYQINAYFSFFFILSTLYLIDSFFSMI